MPRVTSPSKPDRVAELKAFVQKHYPDSERINVALSATGEGHILRWNYSEDLESSTGSPALRTATPSPHSSSGSLVDGDGDSMMGDEEAESEARFRTPLPLIDFDPGSVLLTPRKNRLKHESRMVQRGPSTPQPADDGHVRTRVVLQRADSLVAVREPPEPVPRPRRHSTVVRFAPAKKCPSRHPTALASESTARTSELPTVRRPKGILEREGTPVTMRSDGPHMRIYRDDGAGTWVREGSLDPAELPYDIADLVLPPRASEMMVARSWAGSVYPVYDRTDTESVKSFRSGSSSSLSSLTESEDGGQAPAPPVIMKLPFKLRRSERLRERQGRAPVA
ncbi:uncharacterized protein BXZ73DRAFT_75234 [Epithele typhae]|uniref:uncharacterized protein n=1 Tax=Epithele typhae TaxID=378194 RepID=UPI0020081BE9|nr:uncharacterized protein BXZ73DRAFT_75234 [Epithele typhae]KAH9941280.1 hypothetical protein BXZ73DRAFT_75234 [Epithele typhae]